MIHLEDLQHALIARGAESLAKDLPQLIEQAMTEQRHGEQDRWNRIIDSLPDLPAGDIRLDTAVVSVGNAVESSTRNSIIDLLQQLHPWRKGPYSVHGIYLDTEWRSDWKWQRLEPHISSLKGRTVLDVGCGNGYHCWRMAGAGAGLVIGIDPSRLFLAQFHAIRHFLGNDHPVYQLPLAMEQMPANLALFDTVFSMGVLYHRRSPIDHLLELKAALRAGGELVLETLVVNGSDEQVLVPHGRYAKMRNVWFLPSPQLLRIWLERCGFRNVRVVDITATTVDEQRATDWMHFESLQDFLDPTDRTRTVEGYPAPVRAIVVAQS